MMHGAGAEAQVHKDRRDWHNLKGCCLSCGSFAGARCLRLSCLVLSKVANVGVPVVLKEIVEHFERVRDDPAMLAAVLPVSLLLAYGLLKLGASMFNELRDVVFAKVRYRAMRRLSTRVLEHLHRLSLRFHLDRRTGAVSRDLERGTRSVSQILNYMAFSILPIMVEFTLVAFILLREYDVVFAARDVRLGGGLCAGDLRDHRVAYGFPSLHEPAGFRGQYPGLRQPDQLRDGQVFRQRAPWSCSATTRPCRSGSIGRSRARHPCRCSISARVR